jgi:hypothetical protein
LSTWDQRENVKWNAAKPPDLSDAPHRWPGSIPGVATNKKEMKMSKFIPDEAVCKKCGGYIYPSLIEMLGNGCNCRTLDKVRKEMEKEKKK